MQCIIQSPGHTITVAYIDGPRGTLQGRAECTCGWGTTEIFVELAKEAGLAHARRGSDA